MFSDRTNWKLTRNRLTEALDEVRASGARVLDLNAGVPGFDEPELLLAMSRVAVGRTSITNLAVGLPPGEGLALLHRRIERCLDAGGRVVLIDLYDTPPERDPWKYLRRLGFYD